ncbi:MAG TPA: hypothetical protein VJL58_04475 [Pyrinomonadaceae bacterium]|nr:hypothetical protein [Pyrinomonadaceae bacterium]
MRKRSVMFAMILITLALMLPPDIFGFGQPGKHGRGKSGSIRIWEGDRRDRRRKGPIYGYKNYGQYRSAQVHRRNRYRMVRRYYWRDGIRLSRWVRVYY